MANQWFKMYGGEYLSDPKIAALSGEERSCWVTLLCLASISSVPGTIEYLTREVLLEKSGVRRIDDVTFQPLQAFQTMKMIRIDGANLIEILNWNKRQKSASSVTERVRKYRLKQRLKKDDVTNVTKRNESDNDRIEKNRIEESINTLHQTPPLTQVVDDKFEVFWKQYPRKVGKQAALRAWKRIKHLDLEVILKALEVQKQSEQWRRDGGQYIPHPTTWLIQGRWDDEVETKDETMVIS